MRPLELNCEYVPRDTLEVTDFLNAMYQTNSVYLSQTCENDREHTEIKLSRFQVKELRKWLKQWLKETK